MSAKYEIKAGALIKEPTQTEGVASTPFANFNSKPLGHSTPANSDDDDGVKLTYDPRRFIWSIWSKLWIIMLCTTIAAAGSVYYAMNFVEKEWSSKVILLAENSDTEIAIADSNSYSPPSFELQTLIDTVKLDSNLDKIAEAIDFNGERQTLAAAIKVNTNKKSDIFSIRVRWSDPQTAAKIANLAALSLEDWGRKIRRESAFENVSFYAKQAEEVFKKIATLQSKKNIALLENGVSDVDLELPIILENLASNDERILVLSAEIRAIERTIEKIELQIETEPETVLASTTFRFPLQEKLEGYELNLQEALSSYTEENPKVQKLRKQINFIKEKLNSDEEAQSINEYSPNPRIPELQLAVISLANDRDALGSQLAAYEIARALNKQKLNKYITLQQEMTKLESERENLKSLAQSLQNRIDEATLVMDKNDAFISIQELATPPEKSLPTPNKMIAIVGTLVGIILSTVLVLVLEFFRSKIITPMELKNILGRDDIIAVKKSPSKRKRKIMDENGFAVTPLHVKELTNYVYNARRDFKAGSSLKIGFHATSWKADNLGFINEVASRLSERDLRCLVVDARLPAWWDSEGLNSGEQAAPGLFNLLSGSNSIEDILQKEGSFDVISKGVFEYDSQNQNKEPLSYLEPPHFPSFIQQLGTTYDVILFSLPPINDEEASISATSLMDLRVLCASTAYTKRSEAKTIKTLTEKRSIDFQQAIMFDIEDRYYA